ncbi:MAG TPA: hypothetical protein VGK06_10750 [Methanosarcina sp.]
MRNSTKYAIILLGALLLIALSALALSGTHNNIKLINNSSQGSVKPINESLPWLFIKNWGNKGHEVSLEAFNSKNVSIFNKSYILAPRENIKSHFPIILAAGTYIKVTLDSNITKTQIISKDFSEDNSGSALFIDIDIRPDDPLNLGTAVP